MTIQINFGENTSSLPDELLRMWCVEKVCLMKDCLGIFSAQTVSSEADELYSYIREGVPYEARWIAERRKKKDTNGSQKED